MPKGLLPKALSFAGEAQVSSSALEGWGQVSQGAVSRTLQRGRSVVGVIAGEKSVCGAQMPLCVTAIQFVSLIVWAI